MRDKAKIRYLKNNSSEFAILQTIKDALSKNKAGNFFRSEVNKLSLTKNRTKNNIPNVLAEPEKMDNCFISSITSDKNPSNKTFFLQISFTF